MFFLFGMRLSENSNLNERSTGYFVLNVRMHFIFLMLHVHKSAKFFDEQFGFRKNCHNRKRFISRTSFSSRPRPRRLPSDRLPSRKRVSRRASPICRRT
jgi:hypothetical protein